MELSQGKRNKMLSHKKLKFKESSTVSQKDTYFNLFLFQQTNFKEVATLKENHS